MTWTSARDLATILRVPVGTIHRWASEHQWPRIGRGKRVRYDHERAVETYAARRCEHDRTEVTVATWGRPESEWFTVPGPCRKCGQ